MVQCSYQQKKKTQKLLSEKCFLLRKTKQQLFYRLPLEEDIYLHLCNAQKDFAIPKSKKYKTTIKILYQYVDPNINIEHSSYNREFSGLHIFNKVEVSLIKTAAEMRGSEFLEASVVLEN